MATAAKAGTDDNNGIYFHPTFQNPAFCVSFRELGIEKVCRVQILAFFNGTIRQFVSRGVVWPWFLRSESSGVSDSEPMHDEPLE